MINIKTIKKMLDAGLSVKEVCAKTGICKSSIYRVMHEIYPNTNTTTKREPPLLNRVKEMNLKGYTQSEIAECLGLSRMTVNTWMKRYGIKRTKHKYVKIRMTDHQLIRIYAIVKVTSNDDLRDLLSKAISLHTDVYKQ